MLSLDAVLHQSTTVRLFHTLLGFKAIAWEQLQCACSVVNLSLLLIPHWKDTPIALCISLLKSPYQSVHLLCAQYRNSFVHLFKIDGTRILVT